MIAGPVRCRIRAVRCGGSGRVRGRARVSGCGPTRRPVKGCRPACCRSLVERTNHASAHPDRPRGRSRLARRDGRPGRGLAKRAARGAAPDFRGAGGRGSRRPDAGVGQPRSGAIHARHEIRNVRQLSILSEEDIAAIARKMGLPGLPPEVFGATMLVRGDTRFHAHPAVVAAAGRGERRDPDRRHGKPALPPGVERDRGGASGFRQGVQAGGRRAARRDGLGRAGGRDPAGRPASAAHPGSAALAPCRGIMAFKTDIEIARAAQKETDPGDRRQARHPVRGAAALRP
jgi:hypothetical protein